MSLKTKAEKPLSGDEEDTATSTGARRLFLCCPPRGRPEPQLEAGGAGAAEVLKAVEGRPPCPSGVLGSCVPSAHAFLLWVASAFLLRVLFKSGWMCAPFPPSVALWDDSVAVVMPI